MDVALLHQRPARPSTSLGRCAMAVPFLNVTAPARSLPADPGPLKRPSWNFDDSVTLWFTNAGFGVAVSVPLEVTNTCACSGAHASSSAAAAAKPCIDRTVARIMASPPG